MRMMANFPAIKKNFPKSQSFLMSEWTSRDPGVKDAAFIRLLRVLCGDHNDCGLTVRLLHAQPLPLPWPCSCCVAHCQQ